VSARRWTFARRMALWYALTTTLLVTTILAVSIWALNQSAQRELDALTHEELDELLALFPTTDRTPLAFERLAAEFAAKHPANPMAWRVVDRSGEEWGTFGSEALLAQHESLPIERHRMVRLPNGRRWYADELAGGLTVGLLLDGSAQIEILRSYGARVIVLALLAALLSSAGGAILFKRVARSLRQVADHARSIQLADDESNLGFEGAPEEVREVVDALAEMLRNIRAASDRARLMTAGLAHELRSPIQNLLGEAEVALLKARTGDEYRHVLRSHIDELRDLAGVIDNLVTICGTEECTGGDSFEHFDFGSEAKLRLKREELRAARLDISVELSTSGALECTGDREALLLALRNVVQNAVEWSPEGGRVTVSLLGHASEIEILVDDQGPGVAAHERERIFEAFHRGTTQSGRRTGYGLGLALADRALSSQGGRIEVGDSPAGGARFRLIVPRSRGAVDPPTRSGEDADQSAGARYHAASPQ